MWSHFASSVTINYIGKKERPFWGLTSGKEKCYWPVKSSRECVKPDSQYGGSPTTQLLLSLLKGHFLASVSPSIVYPSPICSKAEIGHSGKPVCNYIPVARPNITSKQRTTVMRHYHFYSIRLRHSELFLSHDQAF